ncbi:toll/interleukin-1 receptor domain-containing protein [Micromonospora sp. NBC_00858]|uniref:toll/interleukin-1 receptor domain-containing protein n=1 Tax=Micromonospora sp. NBC_00858 TaxID=2975979 RepID=UPI00386F80C2|nr:toll/interleukin-1 receptor domain-containing protein [Micromonospora sp. NBC_00858]
MGRLAIGESVMTSGDISDYEALQVFFRVAEERGHRAPSVVVDERGAVLSHPDYVDRMGVAHQRAGAWAFSRAQTAEAFGLPSGTDWIRWQALHLLFEAGSPYPSTPHLHHQLYLQRFGSADTQMLVPVSAAHAVAWSDDGSRVCVMEERLGRLADDSGMAKYLLWEYELGVGSRRLVVGFPAAVRLDFVELTYSPDGRWIHLCDWSQGRNLLVRTDDGTVVPLPVRSGAVAFNPRLDAGDMTVMTVDSRTGGLVIHDYDLSTDRLTERRRLASPTGLPMHVRELAISARGEAVVTAPIGIAGLDQLQRGGVHIAAYIDIDVGEIEPVLSVSFRTPGAQRRHTSPRWLDDRALVEPTPLQVADHLIEAGTVNRCAPDSPQVAEDPVHRWLEIMAATNTAWQADVIPTHRFAQEFVQYAASCMGIDPTGTEEIVKAVRQRSHRDPVAREVTQRVMTGARGWASLPSVAIPTPEPPPVAPPDRASVRAVEQALIDLVAARRHAEAAEAVRALLAAAQRARRLPSDVWRWLATLTTPALAHREHGFVARVALATCLWNTFFLPQDPMLRNLGLLETGHSELLPLLVDGFEATTHLHQRLVVGEHGDSNFDAEAVRNMCQQLLAELPLDEFLTRTRRPTARTGQLPPALDPRVTSHQKEERPTMSRKRVFISYVREDSADVDRIAAALRSAGVEVWLDRTHLLPGQRWASVIRKEINEGDFFVACFSAAYLTRTKTFMNDEVLVAIEQLRLRRPDMIWFLPVLLQPISVPSFSIGGGQTLDTLQCLDIAALGWDEAIKRLAQVICPPAP